ncbi:MAG: cobalt ABC transporter permease [Planctomycetia bacterium]|nr:cobalt ABC transporter permease [Planctomycetia bacterium]
MQPDQLERQSLERHGAAAASPLARIDPRVKLAVAVALLIATSVTQPWWFPVALGVPLSLVHVAVAAAVVAAAWSARLAWNDLARRLALFAIPLAIIGLSIPLSSGRAGWPIMAGVLAKGLLSFAIVIVLVHSTGFDRLLVAFRQLGAPKLLVAMLASMYRYLFVLLEELERMRRARRARTFTRDAVLSPTALKSGAGLIGMLLVRASDRAERVHAAMLARGFDGEVRTLDEAP